MQGQILKGKYRKTIYKDDMENQAHTYVPSTYVYNLNTYLANYDDNGYFFSSLFISS